MPVTFFERRHVLVTVDRRLELARLLDERANKIFGEYLGESGDIENVFFGVQRGELAAGLGKRVDDLGGCTAHPRIKQREEPRGTGPNYRDVADLVRHWGKLAAVRG